MTNPIESPEAFAETLIAGADDVCDAEVEVMLGDDGRAWLVEAIRSRDAAVRREAFAEAAAMFEQRVASWSEEPPFTDVQTGAKAATRWCARTLRALATGGSE